MHQDRGDRAGTVIVLGAGLSRAISESMPLTADLAAPLADAGLAPTGDVEAWLSYLAEDQPFLSRAENLENRARFLRASEVVASTIASRSRAAMASAPPQWLLDFVAAADLHQWTLVSFNYDCLVEAAGCHAGVPIGRSPESDGSSMFKLHGSLADWWDPDDPRDVRPGAGGSPVWGQADPPAHVSHAGRWRPLVVPPTSSKTPFYLVPELRDRWQRASAAIRGAETLAILGYSMPVNDYASATMIGTARSTAEGDHGPSIMLADRYAKAVRTRLHEVGLPEPHRTDTGPSSVGRTVVALIEHGLRTSIERLATWQPRPGEGLDDPADAELIVHQTAPTSRSGQTVYLDTGDFLGAPRPMREWAPVLRDLFNSSPTYAGHTIIGVQAAGFLGRPRLKMLATMNPEDRDR